MNQNLYANDLIRPNDILGIQYIKQCEKHHIEPICISRNETFKSATQTRIDYFNGLSQFNDKYFLENQSWQHYYTYLRKYLILTDVHVLSTFFLVNEGIEYRLKENAKKIYRLG